jgi:hypothetical protein
MSILMKSLDVDKNALLKSVIDPNLVRTGTVGEGSCYFHAVMKGKFTGYSKHEDGTATTIREKKEMAKKLREKVSNSITMDIYLSLYEGNLAKLEFSEIVHEILKKFYDFIENTDKFLKEDKNKNFITLLVQNNNCFYKILTSVISYDEMDKIKSFVFDRCDVRNCGELWLSKTLEVFLENLHKSPETFDLDEKTVDEVEGKIQELLNLICETSLQTSLKKYKKRLMDCGEWADNTMFKLVSDYLDVDTYILTEETGLPYFIPGTCDNMTSGRKNAVIVGSIGNGHFENIGYRKSSSSSGHGKITRLFAPEHPLIQKLHAIYCEPQTVVKKYPSLLNLIPKEARVQKIN